MQLQVVCTVGHDHEEEMTCSNKRASSDARWASDKAAQDKWTANTIVAATIASPALLAVHPELRDRPN